MKVYQRFSRASKQVHFRATRAWSRLSVITLSRSPAANYYFLFPFFSLAVCPRGSFAAVSLPCRLFYVLAIMHALIVLVKRCFMLDQTFVFGLNWRKKGENKADVLSYWNVATSFETEHWHVSPFQFLKVFVKFIVFRRFTRPAKRPNFKHLAKSRTRKDRIHNKSFEFQSFK